VARWVLCREAEARADAAEQAKIELTLALARSDDELRASSTRDLQVCGGACTCLAHSIRSTSTSTSMKRFPVG